MRIRRTIAAPLCALTLAACGDGTGPGNGNGNLTDLIIDFCLGDTPSFFAYQNEGGSWTRVTGDAAGTFSFKATDKVGVAMAFDGGPSGVQTDVFYATAAELQPLSGVACTERTGAKTLNGSVSGVAATEGVQISMSEADAYVFPPDNTFSLTGVADGPRDLIATRSQFTTSSEVPNRVILRRAVNLTNGATIPTLNFTAEGTGVVENTATITGLAAGDENFLDVGFSTALGTDHILYLSPTFTSGTQNIYGLPSTATQAGDLHELLVFADAADSYRVFATYYRNPANKTAALGPTLAVPTITTAGSSPYLRMKATVASQSDYNAFASAYFAQNTRAVYVTVTRGYMGGNAPATWSLEVPDLTAAGYPASSGLQAGAATEWWVEAFGGELAAFVADRPTDGLTMKYAGRSSQTGQAVAARVGKPEQRPRSAPAHRGLVR